MEKVSDMQYGAPVYAADRSAARARGIAGDSAQPSRAQQLMGDIAPKLVQLTDSVLFGRRLGAAPQAGRAR
jgi:4-carboxymuconolactone decarboxylase